MRNFLRNFFCSHGTPLGYLGSLSQKGLPEIFSKWVLINLSNPLRHPTPLVDPLLTKNLDTVGPWCEESWKQSRKSAKRLGMWGYLLFGHWWPRALLHLKHNKLDVGPANAHSIKQIEMPRASMVEWWYLLKYFSLRQQAIRGISSFYFLRVFSLIIHEMLSTFQVCNCQHWSSN